MVLSGFSYSGDELKNIRENCGNLKHIDMGSREEDHENVADFIASYGDLLELVAVRSMAGSQLNRVADACRNARFHAMVFANDLLLQTLRILGPRLEKMICDCDPPDCDFAIWSTSWNLRTNLMVLLVSDVIVGAIRAIMSTPKHQLKEIRILSDINEEDVYRKPETVTNIIAKGTKNVQELQIPCWFACFGAFTKFIDKSKSTLRSFSIINNIHDPPSSSEIGEIIARLSECTALEVVTFDEEL